MFLIIRAMAGNITLQEHYAFCGMQHIFDRHRDAVTVIKFGKDDKTVLAFASRDTTLSVFTLINDPPSLLCTLTGHDKCINGKVKYFITFCVHVVLFRF